MSSIHEQFTAAPRGGILYDASRVRKAGPELFEHSHWSAKGALQKMSGGRGSVAILRTDAGRWVLRHYRRGGLFAKVSRDRYLWTGESRTRSFVEWRLLAELKRRGLPVPAPIAARYVRSTLTYRADLITEFLPETQTLANSVTDASVSQKRWRDIGSTIAAFHREGVHHADLNAHNILLSADANARSPVYVLDFDRGRLRERGAWETAVLNRLHRSLEKIKRERQGVVFGEREWGWMRDGYQTSGQRTADSGQ